MAKRRLTIPAPSEARLPPALQVRVLLRDHQRCVYCGVVVGPFQVDHVRPRAHFRRDTPSATVNAASNLVAACETCNGAKGPQDLAGFSRMLTARGVLREDVDSMTRRVRRATRRPIATE